LAKLPITHKNDAQRRELAVRQNFKRSQVDSAPRNTNESMTIVITAFGSISK